MGTQCLDMPFKPIDGNHLGILYKNKNGNKPPKCMNVFADEELFIGRYPKSRHLTVSNGPVLNEHLRIYPVVFQNEGAEGAKRIAPLVYAESLSPNGIWWNGTRMNKEDGPILLSDGDSIGISPVDILLFKCEKPKKEQFSDAQRKEMPLFESEYEIRDCMLGKGAYGRVYMACDRTRGKQVVCKIVDISKVRQKLQEFDDIGPPKLGDDPQYIDKAKREAERRKLVDNAIRKLEFYDREFEIVQDLHHPNIIGLEKVFKTDNTLYIFQELAAGGDLLSYLDRRRGQLAEVEAAVIVRQIVLALEYLHNRKIVHRDLKADNVLLASLATGTRIILTDFGCGRRFGVEGHGPRMRSFNGTLEYSAPEMRRAGKFRNCRGYTESVDLWSLGCLTGMLLTGSLPFIDPRSNRFSEGLAQEARFYHSETDPNWLCLGERPRDFVQRLLVVDEIKRMTAKDAKMHPWLTNPVHKKEFDTVYERAMKSWKPRLPRDSIVHDFSTDIRALPSNGSRWPFLGENTSSSASTKTEPEGMTEVEDSPIQSPSLPEETKPKTAAALSDPSPAPAPKPNQPADEDTISPSRATKQGPKTAKASRSANPISRVLRRAFRGRG